MIVMDFQADGGGVAGTFLPHWRSLGRLPRIALGRSTFPVPVAFLRLGTLGHGWRHPPEMVVISGHYSLISRRFPQ